MPSVIALKNILDNPIDQVPDIYFLLKEQDFPYEAVELIQQRLRNRVKLEGPFTRDTLIKLAENVVLEYGGTVMPFVLYIVEY